MSHNIAVYISETGAQANQVNTLTASGIRATAEDAESHLGQRTRNML